MSGSIFKIAGRIDETFYFLSLFNRFIDCLSLDSCPLSPVRCTQQVKEKTNISISSVTCILSTPYALIGNCSLSEFLSFFLSFRFFHLNIIIVRLIHLHEQIYLQSISNLVNSWSLKHVQVYHACVSLASFTRAT